jgi:Ca2+-binding EF-hand superfamily protein
VISRAEFDAMGQQMKARMENAGLRRGGTESRMFDATDANKDGHITPAEMQQAALSRFDRLDLNHDGTISLEERQQARQLFKGQRKPQ